MTLEEKLREYQEKIKQNPLTSVIITTALFLLLLIIVPYVDISLRGINNATVEATLENQSRATLAQIFGGVAIGIGLYYTWRRISISEKELKATQKNLAITQKNLRVAQENLKISQESQITERFTRAVDQLGAIDHLGNPAVEIRLGGIYALERISTESEKDYLPIMEILTAYVRKNSNTDIQLKNSVPITVKPKNIQATGNTNSKESKNETILLDIQAIITVIGRRQHSSMDGDTKKLNLQITNLQHINFVGGDFRGTAFFGANLSKANLNRANFSGADIDFVDLSGAHLSGTNLSKANLTGANLSGANLPSADLSGACLILTDLPSADLSGANLSGANLSGANLSEADLSEADLSEADLSEADLTAARNLSFNQLSRAKTLYTTELDKKFLLPLKEQYPNLFKQPGSVPAKLSPGVK